MGALTHSPNPPSARWLLRLDIQLSIPLVWSESLSPEGAGAERAAKTFPEHSKWGCRRHSRHAQKDCPKLPVWADWARVLGKSGAPGVACQEEMGLEFLVMGLSKSKK